MNFESADTRIEPLTGFYQCLGLLPLLLAAFVSGDYSFFKDSIFLPLYSGYLSFFIGIFDLIVLTSILFRFLTRKNSLHLTFLIMGFFISLLTDITLIFHHPVFHSQIGFIYDNRQLIVLLYLFRSLSLCYFLAVSALLKAMNCNKNSLIYLLGLLPWAMIMGCFMVFYYFPHMTIWHKINPRVIFYTSVSVGYLFFILSSVYFFGLEDSFGLGLLLFALCMFTSMQFGMHGIHFEDRAWNMMLSTQIVGSFLAILCILKNAYDRVKLLIHYSNMVYEKSISDPLTGIYNRGFFIDTLRKQINEHPNKPLTLCIADIDHFKSINDTFGHVSGDRVIQNVAALLVTTVGDQGTVARIGGEEFAILLTDQSQQAAGDTAARIMSNVRQLPAVISEQHQHKISISLGIYHAASQQSELNILSRADEALYYAKSHGRDRCVAYSDIPTSRKV